MYSQNNEETYILDYLKTADHGKPLTGRCLDIGAYDGKTFSNSRALLDLGWKLVAIEPDPYAFINLISNLAGFHSHVILINAVLATNRAIVPFHSSGGDAISSTSDAHRVKWENNYKCKFHTHFVPTITIDDVLDKFPSPYEFVNVDTEGTNLTILQSLPLARMGCRILCVEHDRQIELVRAYAASQGLTKELTRNGENIIMAR
jgi:FkbM family methyltransferase